jgi:hypothetical protein
LLTVFRHVYILLRCILQSVCNILPIERLITLIFTCHIQARRLDMLFVLGGNGTHAGANAIHEEVLFNQCSL